MCGEPGTRRGRHARPARRPRRQVDGDGVGGPSARSRYRLLETLRAFGRERLREVGADDAVGRAHAPVLRRPRRGARAAGCTGPTSGRGSSAPCPTTTTCAPRSSGPSPTGTATSRSRWSPRCPSWCTCASATSRPAGPSGRSSWSDGDHPLRAAAVGAAARGAWNRGEFAAARALAERAGGVAPGRGTGRIAYPGDVLADVALYEGDADAALRHYDGEVRRARRRRRPDPARLDPLLRRGVPRRAAHARAGHGRGRGSPSRSPRPPATRRRCRWRATPSAWC